MRQVHTAVLERLRTVNSNFETEPHEVGWASEAIAFVEVEYLSDSSGSGYTSHVQVSPDGINWTDEGTVLEWPENSDTGFARVSHFGGWLRLRTVAALPEREAKVTIQLVLKD